MCERQSVPNADFIFFTIMTTELSAGCWFPSRSLCSWGMFWVCCIRRLNMGLVFMMSVLRLPCPDVALLRVFPCEQQGCAAGRWPEPGGLPVICLARSHQAISCFCVPPSPAKPASSQGTALEAPAAPVLLAGRDPQSFPHRLDDFQTCHTLLQCISH